MLLLPQGVNFRNLRGYAEWWQRAGCPVISGTKWTATAWIHTKPFHPEWMEAPFTDKVQRPENCEV
jgi:hypothetical protein